MPISQREGGRRKAKRQKNSVYINYRPRFQHKESKTYYQCEKRTSNRFRCTPRRPRDPCPEHLTALLPRVDATLPPVPISAKAGSFPPAFFGQNECFLVSALKWIPGTPPKSRPLWRLSPRAAQWPEGALGSPDLPRPGSNRPLSTPGLLPAPFILHIHAYKNEKPWRSDWGTGVGEQMAELDKRSQEAGGLRVRCCLGL